MIKSVFKSMLALVTLVASSICSAENLSDLSLGNCGFAGPEFMTNDYNCHQIQQRSDTGIKREALVQLASMAWGWITGKSAEEDPVEHWDQQQASLNKGNKFEPKFALKAHSDDVYLTVAYEF